MKTEHQFKPGERFKIGQKVLIPAIVVSFSENGYSFKPTDKTEEVIPAPRDEEYRLTAEEIHLLIADFVRDCTDAPFFGAFPEENLAFIKQWLANRKEEV